MQVVVTHDVDDVEHWFNSPKRDEFFEQHGMKATAFRSPDGVGNSTVVVIETPDMDTLHAALQTEDAQEAQAHDGVRVDTVRVFVAN